MSVSFRDKAMFVKTEYSRYVGISKGERSLVGRNEAQAQSNEAEGNNKDPVKGVG